MKWNELTIATTEESIEMISNFLHEMGAGGVSIEESGTLNKERDTSLGQWYELPLNDIPEGQAVIKGYFPEDTDIEEVITNVRPRIDELREFDIEPGEYTISSVVVDDEDWANAWKQYFKPIRVSDRLTIKPTWEDYTPSEGEQIIELDPGMAFGTGTHPTTALCLRTLESVIQGGEEVIDVGTGSGILAIGAMRLGAKKVLAVDLDPIAVTAAGENSKLNGLEGDIQVQLSDLLGVLQASAEGSASQAINVSVPVDVVVANILAEIILLFVDDVYAAVKAGGTYIASGIYKNKEDDVASGLEASGFVITGRQRDQDWIAFVAKKPE
ncbi:50S ribosomal protein L11 methyltransferase [Paenibacillus solisilvae]|uniref:Ribosomal protein L11 methyltransferase n=1 Tax=Paenibacillus solisilvae TaxID=2486751 RepID=A0ABW0W4T9_9BACL